MVDVVKLRAANARRWASAKLTRGPEFVPVARRLVASQARFQAMETRTGVPWYVIAVIKEREAGADPQWLKSIAQGQAWNRRSTVVPTGRGPFKSWEEAAYDALVNCAPYAAKNKDWSIGGILTLLEGYNGFGYAGGPTTRKSDGTVVHYPPQASPYIWSGTDQYKSGKYVADHVFDPNAVDKQLGCAGVLLAMQAIDASIKFDTPKPAVTTADVGKGAVVATTTTAVVAGVHRGWGAWEWGLLAAGIVIVALAVVCGLRWWKHRNAAPAAVHDRVVTAAMAIDRPRRARKPAAKRPVAKKRTRRKAA